MSEKVLICPKCGYPYYCGCDACLPRRKLGEIPHISRPDIDGHQCPICGFAQSCDGWLSIEEKQFPIQIR